MDKDIKKIQQEFEKKEEQERAMKNVTCPKLANTLVKLQQVYNEFYEEYDRAYDLGVRDKNEDGIGFHDIIRQYARCYRHTYG